MVRRVVKFSAVLGLILFRLEAVLVIVIELLRRRAFSTSLPSTRIDGFTFWASSGPQIRTLCVAEVYEEVFCRDEYVIVQGLIAGENLQCEVFEAELQTEF